MGWHKAGRDGELDAPGESYRRAGHEVVMRAAARAMIPKHTPEKQEQARKGGSPTEQ